MLLVFCLCIVCVRGNVSCSFLVPHIVSTHLHMCALFFFCLLRLRAYMLDNGLATEADIKAIDKRVEDEVSCCCGL